MGQSDSANLNDDDLMQQIQRLDAAREPSAQSREQVLAYAREQLNKTVVTPHNSPRWALPVGLLAAMVMCAGIYAQMAKLIETTGGSGGNDSNIVTRSDDAPIIIELLPGKSVPQRTDRASEVELEPGEQTQAEPPVGPWLGIARMQSSQSSSQSQSQSQSAARHASDEVSGPHAEQIDCSQVAAETTKDCQDRPAARH